MSDAPERIWVDDERPEGGEFHVWADLSEQACQWAVEYIRADVSADRIADLERQLDATLMELAETQALELQHGAVIERLQRQLAEARAAALEEAAVALTERWEVGSAAMVRAMKERTP